ncbi:hypothetical protein ACNAW0_22665 [Micromonospora sp. SL1-18]|uniref:LppU/SCO3897 family protein n=1 Tax=Micromonospora sp. SL1-18 TaxID=3399128 RepID=UPI003A4DFB73
MTSEVPHRPGQEPGEVTPGAGGPAPYGDRPAQQDNGYPGAADLGWAPPPPAGPPAQPAPAWGNPNDQRPAWAQPGGQPAAGRASAQVPPPGQPGAWGGSPQAAWGAPEQGSPAWSAAPPAPAGEQAPPAWAAAPANAPAESAPPAWSPPGEQNGPGWGTAAGPQDDQPVWGQQSEPAARAAVSVPGAPADNWPTHDDPDGSGRWAAGRDAGQAEAPHPPAWGTPNEQRPAWEDAAAAPQQRDQDRPTDEPAQTGRDSATGPTPGDRPESGAWTPARASVSVPSPDSPSAWGGAQDAPQWTPERPAVPDAEPWAPGEAWGQPGEAAPDESASNGWEPARAEEAPVYQPAPAPGISPGSAVPLPPQEQRVPGAALAASPPTDYMPPGQFAPAAEPAGRPYEPEQAAWGTPEAGHEEPQSPAGPVVPGPRTSPESGAAGVVSASASVPMASRVTPPTDQPLHAAGVPAPQPRVYGRPARPESEEPFGQDASNSFPEAGPRFDEPGPAPRFDEAASNAFAEAPPAPSSPAGPPPFPPGMPSFADPVGNNRPVNGVHPQSDERPGDPFGVPGGHQDPFGGPGGHQNPFGGPGGHQDPFGAPGGPQAFGAPGGQQNPFGAPGGYQDPFGAPGGDPFAGPGGQHDAFGAPGGGHASGAVPGPGAMGAPDQGNFPPAYPPPPAPPAWSQGPTNEADQGRFDAFKPEAEPQAEAPTPKVRNGRVLAAVLIAAVLILAVPLGLLALLGKIGGDDKSAGFDPAVGSCVKQAGTNGVAAADCGAQGAFTVVSKVDAEEKCGDPAQPHVVLPGDGANRVLCLKPAGK